jgi:hypothetical protein
MLPPAVGGCTLKDVDTTLVDIFNTGRGLEEYINWRNPILGKAI